MTETNEKTERQGTAGGSGLAIAGPGPGWTDAPRTRQRPRPRFDAHPAPGPAESFVHAWLEGQDIAGRRVVHIDNLFGETGEVLARLGARVRRVDMLSGGPGRGWTDNPANRHLRDTGVDMVVGRHALAVGDPDRAAAELAELLDRDGTAILIEPLGRNPFMRNRLERRLIGGSPAYFKAPSPLSADQVDRLRAHFGGIDIQVFGLLTPPVQALASAARSRSALLARQIERLSQALTGLDRALLRVGWLKRYAANAVIVLRWPRVHERD